MRRGRPAVLALALALTTTALGVAAALVPTAGAAPTVDTVVVIGASISAGYQASPGGAWPELTDRALAEQGAATRVHNASISATRLLTSYPELPSSLSREVSDGLEVPGVRALVLTDVINDIQAEPHQYDAEQILDGIRTFVATAHQHGVSAIVMTLTPYGGFQRYDPVGEGCRQQVNAALRAGGLADVVVDADRILADPDDPTRILPAYDSGDHLHPDDAGQQALSEAMVAALDRGRG
ncbi:MAG: GDSL-type esterase/lipase family protein [Cellulomonas sp.]|nr:GDSL-type esterase/lipase family protein [Cellulomonas sp.]